MTALPSAVRVGHGEVAAVRRVVKSLDDSGTVLSRLDDLDAAEEHLHLALDIHGLDHRTCAFAGAGTAESRRPKSFASGQLASPPDSALVLPGQLSLASPPPTSRQTPS
ncbi:MULTISPECIES: hypothetical protein [Streptomyces]|uniref:hypothetical protein n=1 Tax=Streptomyces TaxID=1883 RepID=UPI001624590A|nr:hypothetical protein [Streptomyces sp. INR7]